MIIVVEMNTLTRVQNLDEAVSIAHCTNTLVKDMNPTILPPAMGKLIGETGLLSLGMVTSLGEWKIWI